MTKTFETAIEKVRDEVMQETYIAIREGNYFPEDNEAFESPEQKLKKSTPRDNNIMDRFRTDSLASLG